jgi:alkaline phosphatase
LQSEFPLQNALLLMRLPRSLAAAALVLLFAAGTASAQSPPAEGRDAPRNVVLMIADGAGPATFTMARDFERYRQGEPEGLDGPQEGGVRLALDALELGSIQTYAANSRITDSAAGATAFSTGHKTNNGFVAVDTAGRPLATLLEAVQRRGMATGLVATSRLTHATPASFAAHTPDRWKENKIARQLLAHEVDLMLGGGRRHFLPQSAEDSEREDGRDLLDEAREAGYTVVTGRDGFQQVDALPVLGVFANGHLPYVIDRDSGKIPSLEAMTQKALRLLSESEQGRKNGVFLMVEGSRIDHAGHNNDAAAHLRETLAYDDAVAAAQRFAERDGETLLLSTADHGTGGLSLGRNIDGEGRYAWKPSALAEVEASHGVMMRQVLEEGADPATVLRRQAGVDSLAAGEREMLAEAVEAESYGRLEAALSEIIGRRAVVGWTTGGHTAVDVGLYGYGPGAERFVGHHDNTYVGAELAELLGVDLDALTAEIRREREEQAATVADSE